MALENYRITEFQEKTQVDNGDYVLIDSATDGTHKYQLSRIPAQASAEVAAAVAAEETAREAADAAEVTARNAAISAAISDEVTARNAAISANVDDTLTVSGKASDAKKTGDEIADLKSDLNESIDGLSVKQYSPDLDFEYGYIDGSTGAEKTNTINARTKIISLNVGDYIEINSNYGSEVYHVYVNGVWNEYTTRAGLISSGYVDITYPSTGIIRLTATVAFDVRIVVNRPSNAEITDLSQAEQIANVVLYYNYTRIDNLESNVANLNSEIPNIQVTKNALIKPDYALKETVSRTVAGVTFPVNLVSGHTYKATFVSSSALNQSSFYLQIWQTESIADTSTVLKNFGDVWGTQDTSEGLEYEFVADQDYLGYFRFGYALSAIPSDVTVMEELYDLTDPNVVDVKRLENDVATINYWAGKKIVWFGTSIPAGVVNAGDEGGNGAYPTRIGQLLGATVYNEAVGSSAARIGKHGNITQDDPNGYAGVPATCCLLSLSGTVAEKQEILTNWEYWRTVFTVGVDDVDPTNPDKYLNSSYERKLDKYLSGGSVGAVDLYVFDHGYNDAGNSNGSNYSDTTDVPTNLYDRTYFIGAMNFLIDRIKQDNFRASIVIISHYNDEGPYANLVEAQSYIANKWNIPFINISNKMGFTTAMSVTIDGTTKTMKNWWLPDGIHPSSDATGKALQHYAEVLYPLIRDVW